MLACWVCRLVLAASPDNNSAAVSSLKSWSKPAQGKRSAALGDGGIECVLSVLRAIPTRRSPLALFRLKNACGGTGIPARCAGLMNATPSGSKPEKMRTANQAVHAIAASAPQHDG